MEQALGHFDVVGQSGQLFPRMNQRIAEHRVFHQPQAERQNQFAAQSRGHLRIHDDEAAAGQELIPCVAQHGAMMRHGVVRQAEQHPVQRRRRGEFDRIALQQFNIVPAIGGAQFSRLPQHAPGNIDAVNASGGTHRLAQITKASAGAAADIEHVVARPQVKTSDCVSARIPRQKKHPIEQRNILRDTVVAVPHRVVVTVHPRVCH